ncbi:UNVERIFIED_CONTAM: hypothetical protein GTU68_042086 [Idotea baltica]|nr:hypothetical protein [Idotea baltica]
MAKLINEEYLDKNPIFIGVLNGSFMFAADFLKEINIDCEISFIKIRSYVGMESSGELLELIGIDDDIEGREVILLEDIIDTGHTMNKLLKTLKAKNAGYVRIVTLLLKPEAFEYTFPIHYTGFEIPNKFVVGYGLDYDGRGRNYRSIYQLKES